jgi:hypothetical protein
MIIPGISGILASMGELASYIFLIAMIAIGIVAGRIASSAYARSKSKDVRMNIFEIPLIAQMEEKGWFLLQDDAEVSRLVFTRKKFSESRMKYGEDEAE